MLTKEEESLVLAHLHVFERDWENCIEPELTAAMGGVSGQKPDKAGFLTQQNEMGNF